MRKTVAKQATTHLLPIQSLAPFDLPTQASQATQIEQKLAEDHPPFRDH